VNYQDWKADWKAGHLRLRLADATQRAKDLEEAASEWVELHEGSPAVRAYRAAEEKRVEAEEELAAWIHIIELDATPPPTRMVVGLPRMAGKNQSWLG
jgi:hypothetical protein